MADFELIETQADLESLVPELMTKKVLAFDTEEDSFYHYFDKTCLVQVATRSQIYHLRLREKLQKESSTSVISTANYKEVLPYTMVK